MQIVSTSGSAKINDDAAFDLTDDVEWRFDLSADAWWPSDLALAGRWDTAGDNREWDIRQQDFDNSIQILLGAGDGTFRGQLEVVIGSPPSDSDRMQVQCQLDADDGAGNTVYTVYTRQGGNIGDLETDTNWTNEGTASLAGVQSWKATTNPMYFGANGDGTNPNVGGLYRFIMWKDLTKTTKVADVDFTDESTLDAGATDDAEWDDAVSANDWVMQGTHETDWDYIRVGGGPSVTWRERMATLYGFQRRYAV